ncbi:MAG: SMP-30/gluconolactonase/LRE family protein [Rhodobacteraceae bacterium]|nr:SMP-30/gluconolactonase/LRE family protein [Paracoccaceae bacterium]
MAGIFDDRPCELGEGPLWHPGRGQLWWFDILGRRLLTRTDEGAGTLHLPEMFSAAGWVDHDRLFAASETGFWLIDIPSGRLERIAALLADDPGTRSNDGRADPWGGFWIGTMGKRAEPGRGAIHRYLRGEVRTLFPGIGIPNAISFTPDRRFAHFADSAAAKVWRVKLDAAGWPAGEPSLFLDLAGQAGVPDGAVCDAAGNLWLAEWGAARVAVYGPDGRLQRTVGVAGRHASCPAFGGPGLGTLFVTSARENLTAAEIAAEPLNGCTFMAEAGAKGLPEPAVVP